MLVLSFLLACSENDIRKQPIEEIPPNDSDSPLVVELLDPVAKCEASKLVINPPFNEVTLIGSNSFDPEGHEIVAYDWQIASTPPMSLLTLPTDGADRVIMPDLAGVYSFSLTVTTDDGRSNQCSIAIEAIPSENLWIELYWTYAGDDLDLHLLQPGGESFTDEDCYWMNCPYGLPWGVAGTTDDPFLDFDNIFEVGPENINIAEPAVGTYTVAVHDYPSSVFNGPNSAHVNIYLDGVLVWQGDRDITVEDSLTSFATIQWPSGIVTAL